MLSSSRTDPIVDRLLQIGSHFNKRKNKPNAILMISAHYESNKSIRVTSSPQPGRSFDNFGFDSDYDPPGNPELAQRVKDLLTKNNIRCDLDPKRKFDHGVYGPLKVAFPKADIPVVALSLHTSLDPKIHLDIGKALEPLRKERVLLVGSGMSFHNLNALFQFNRQKPVGYDFNRALSKAVTNPNAMSRNMLLRSWHKFPGAREAHPREEHLVPLFVIAGAAGSDIGKADSFVAYGASVSSFSFP